jgi:hypothetical protein
VAEVLAAIVHTATLTPAIGKPRALSAMLS